MIIHNLHKKTRKQDRKRGITFVIFTFSILFSLLSNAQDSIVLEASIDEKTSIDFEQKFFNAITQKAINNYQKAIENLEECNALIPDDKAILFEFSKNYFFLNKLPEALEYGNEALAKDPENIWLLEHLVSIHRKNKNFDKAIEIQEQIGNKNPKKKSSLVYLYLQNGDRKSAKKMLAELSESKLLTPRLRRLNHQLNRKKEKPKKTSKKVNSNNDLKQLFEEKKSFTLLTQLLAKLDKNNHEDLLTYSERGISLFPAQPMVYLMNGKALNKEKKHKKAIESLQNGIDFVIDNMKLEKQFYSEIVKAYKALGDSKNVNKYQNKIK